MLFGIKPINPLLDHKILYFEERRENTNKHNFPVFPLMCLTHYQTTNFRRFQAERVCRRQFSNLTKMEESHPNRWKTLREKEKLLITSNFSFSHSVFKRLVSQRRQKVSLSGNALKLFSCRLLKFG